MALLVGYKDTKPGATYDGKEVEHIAVAQRNKKNWFHVMSKSTMFRKGDTLAVIDPKIDPFDEGITDEQKADAKWLWDNMA